MRALSFRSKNRLPNEAFSVFHIHISHSTVLLLSSYNLAIKVYYNGSDQIKSDCMSSTSVENFHEKVAAFYGYQFSVAILYILDSGTESKVQGGGITISGSSVLSYKCHFNRKW